ncbi:MAG TPA: proline iminopeptidase-family hydrolase [Longimicrobium sp.]|jgi:proline iminopeptidase
MRNPWIGPLALALAATGCSEKKPAPGADAGAAGTRAAASASAAAEAYLPVPGGRIWYRKSGSGGGTPVILLHGGPGLNSYYLKPLEALGDDRPVIRYDQLGSGKSDTISDTTAFTIAHFVNELDSLRASLGYDRVHLLGHSWGTILAWEYYRAHPEHVASLVLGSPALDIPAWERNARRLVGTLSDSAQRAIRVREAEGKFDAPDYQSAMNEFYGKYVFRRPVQADLDSSFASFNQGIYNYMQGPSEFTITGTLKTYNAVPQLATARVPVLFTVGEFDEADPETVRRQAALTPGARVEVIPGAAHITTWDNPEAMLRAVRGFLRAADSAGAR